MQGAVLVLTANVSLAEQVLIFLYFAGQRPTNRAMQERFQHSGETITRYGYRGEKDTSMLL